MLEIVKITIPAIIVAGIAYFLIKAFLDNEKDKRIVDLKQTNSSVLTPLRLQAYERAILFLERILPNNLIIRVYKPGMNNKLLYTELTRTVRAEFDHNLSQQIYISSTAWGLIKNAKEETIRVINLAFASVNDAAPATDLSQKVLDTFYKQPKNHIQEAIDSVKKEVSSSF